MSFRLRAMAAGLVVLGTGLPAGAQIESSGLRDVSAWGVSFLNRGEADFGQGLWTGSDLDYLLALMDGIDVSALSQAERQLLSRALRAPSAAPESDLTDAFLEARAQLLLALGERRAAATLADQGGLELDNVNPDILLSDERLIRGEREVVCAQMNTSGEGRFWSELRALCALEEGRDADAELAIEIAGQQPDAEPWFTNVAFAVLADQDERPSARYGSGIQIALSDLAELDPDEDSLSETRPDIAAGIASDDSQPLGLRLDAAWIAARAGMISPELHRELYRVLISREDFAPQTPVEAAFIVLAKAPEPEDPFAGVMSRRNGPVDLRSRNEDWIEPVRPGELDDDALEADPVDEISLAEEQALAVHDALRAAESRADFVARARLFEMALEDIPARDDTAGAAMAFAVAAMETGNIALTDKWLDVVGDANLDDAGEFRFALLEGYATVFGGERRDIAPSEFVSALLEYGVEPGERAAALKLFSVWAGFDMPVPANARAALATSEFTAREIGSGMLTSIKTAERNGAVGEAVLGMISQTSGDSETLSGSELSTILWTLGEMGALADAKALTLEASGLWRLAGDDES